ncbi:hypothetical protein FEE59_13935 [Herbaspirillum sp. RU 5E]|uniref:hypothetical protein n=1 Tax=Herbaspirillum sp. VT-16-41 TaxID=1953765 RepID=UPI001115AA23|nr:hypothetical protein [Herbaspirillum sp. VT-16-41]MBW9334611.1 hypothetical protein [Herbaspirillum sp. RU 5E]
MLSLAAVRIALGALLIGLIPISATAQGTTIPARSYGDWIVSVTDEGMPYAAAINSAGDILMKRCDAVSMTCTWIQGIAISCDDGASSPALLNSDQGAYVHILYCRGSFSSGQRTYYRYEIDSQDQLDSVVMATSRVVGIAMALESGQFNVTRYSVKGAKGAIEALFQLTREMNRRSSKTQTGNQRL